MTYYDPNQPAPAEAPAEEAPAELTPEEQAAADKKAKAEEDEKAIADIAQGIHRGLNPSAPPDADASPYMEFARMYYFAANPPPPPEEATEEPAPEAQAA